VDGCRNRLHRQCTRPHCSKRRFAQARRPFDNPDRPGEHVEPQLRLVSGDIQARSGSEAWRRRSGQSVRVPDGAQQPSSASKRHAFVGVRASFTLLLSLVVSLTVSTVAAPATWIEADVRECTGTHNAFPGTRDDAVRAPTDKAYVQQVLATSRRRLRRQFPGVRELRVARRKATVWSSGANGIPTRTGTVVEYRIVVGLRSRSDCPSGPWFWSGVPLEFVTSP
jgi:hypothetical protein